MSERNLPEYCEKALRYYIGEEDAYPMVPEDSQAYCTINSLFFSGLESERKRTAEGKKLNPEFLEENVPTLALCADLLTALRFGGVNKGEQILYRMSRETDVNAMEQACTTISFTSTSKIPYLEEYAKKIDLILLEFHIPANTPRADMSELLLNYPKPSEQEVLLPPWLPVKLKKVSLSKDELKYLDFNKKPPKAKYIVEVTGDICFPPYDNSIKVEPVGCETGKAVYDALNNGDEPSAENVNAYLKWKKQFISMIAILAHGVTLRDVMAHEIDECQYITEGHYTPDDLFNKDNGEKWLLALLGIKPTSTFAERIRKMTQVRLIHTIATYLLGCHIQENLLLSFDTLPRIFSTKTKGSAFSFFWSMACLCHDIGYMYENEDRYKERRGEMLTSEGRKTLLNVSRDLLSVNEEEDYGKWGMNDEEIKWIKESIALINKYNELRVVAEGKYHKKIDHGIAGAIIMYDYMMSIAKPRTDDTFGQEHRDPQKFAETIGKPGYARANRGHSRFCACCLMIALTVARHNVYTLQKGASDSAKQLYIKHKLEDLIIDNDKRLSMDTSMNQLLYMLQFMDTIDPIKAFYLRVVENKHVNDPDELEFCKRYLLDEISIRCVHRREDWQDIEFYFGRLDDKYELFTDYLDNITTIHTWLNTKEAISVGKTIANVFFPVNRRTCKPNIYGIEEEEIMDLCLYEGCGDSVRPGLFYQLPCAYQTFNLLMMDGLDGEKARIGKEGQKPNGVYISNWRRTLKVFKNVFSAMCKYYIKTEEVPAFQMFRADRRENSIMMRKHMKTIAFTSTSTADFLEGFAKGKKGLTYIDCRLSKIVPIADYEAILGDDYVYSDEAEVLLPPWLAIERIDNEGEKPNPYETGEIIQTYSIMFGDMSFDDCSETKNDLIRILDRNCDEAAIILDDFRNDPDKALKAKEEEYLQYIEWKKAFKKLINLEFGEMWKRMTI